MHPSDTVKCPLYAINVEDRQRKQKLLTPCRHVATQNTDDDGGDVQLDDKSDNPVSVQNAAEFSESYNNDDDDDNNNNNADSCEAHHSDVVHRTADPDAERNPSGSCRIKKSVSFRAEPKRPSVNAEGDKCTMSSTLRGVPPARHRDGQQHQHGQPATSVQTSRNMIGSPQRGCRSVKTVLRDRNEKQDSDSRRAQSECLNKRSTSASRLMTQRDTGVVAELNTTSSGSSVGRPPEDRQQRPATDHHRLRSTSIDLTGSASTEVRSPTSLATSSVERLRHRQDDCRTGAGSKVSPNAINVGNKLEPESYKRTTWTDTSAGRGRAATRVTFDQPRQPTNTRHHEHTKTTSTSTSTTELAELGKVTPLQRTWSSKANRTSQLRTNKNTGNDDLAFNRPGVSQFRRSMVATRPKHVQAFVDAGSDVQPPPAKRSVNCGPTRTRSVSLSEQYRMLIGGDWFDDFATLSAGANQQNLTPVNGRHKPIALSRELKPDFVIYV